MNSIFQLIRLIKTRPTMYITRNSISCLKAFIDGWHFRDPDSLVDFYEMDNFQKWIESKYHINTSHSWCDIILFYSLDESTALINFFKDFEEWEESLKSK